MFILPCNNFELIVIISCEMINLYLIFLEVISLCLKRGAIENHHYPLLIHIKRRGLSHTTRWIAIMRGQSPI
jgi:hypothetical protein